MGFPFPPQNPQEWSEDGTCWETGVVGFRRVHGARGVEDKSIGPEKLNIVVKSRLLNAPPLNPVQGDRYIIATPGAVQTPWEYRDGQIAEFNGVSWTYKIPTEGWLAWLSDEQIMLTTNSALQWTAFETLNIPNSFVTY
jgi:Protein of unknown function (DUF2793)